MSSKEMKGETSYFIPEAGTYLKQAQDKNSVP